MSMMGKTEQHDPVWKRRLRSIGTEVEELVLHNENGNTVAQGKEQAEVVARGQRYSFRLHDYPTIFSIRGLYEEIFYERLGCDSPRRVAKFLHDVLTDHYIQMPDLRVLDVGAGNGMVGDELRELGVETIVGIDLLQQAREATFRDRPGVYTSYLVADLTRLSPQEEHLLRKSRLNCLTMVAALGIEDIQAGALVKGLDLLEAPGWAAFTVREDILRDDHDSGFSRLFQQLGKDGQFTTEAFWRYRHRFLTSGAPVFYCVLIVRKHQ